MPSRASSLIAMVVFLCSLPHHAMAGIGSDFSSPFTTPARYVFWLGTAITLAVVIKEDGVSDPAQRQAIATEPIGPIYKVGDYGGRMIPNGLYVLGMLVGGAAGNPNAFRRAEIMTSASVYSAVVATALKYTVREPRPNDSSDRKSFPSGHATSAFAFASVVGSEHGPGYGILAYGLAGIVAYSRMHDNKHYLHDVIAGATIGTSYGLGIHFKRKIGGSTESVSLTPILDKGLYGLSAKVSF